MTLKYGIEPLENRVLLSRTWIVATTGSDANPGTLAAPFASIEKAATLAQPGDTVMIRGGVYRETVTPAHSGTAAAPITFEPYQNEQVTIDGADPIATPNRYNSNVFWGAMPWTLGPGDDQVFAGGQMLNEARWPNTGTDLSHPVFATAPSITSSSAYSVGEVPATATISDAALPGGNNAWAGATIHIAGGQGWWVQTGTVLNSSPGSLTFAFLHLGPSELPISGNRFYLTGSFQALDAPGEWYRDPNTSRLYVWSPANNGQAPQNVEAKHRLFGFELSGLSYIVVQGIDLFACSIDTNAASTHLWINGINAQYVWHSTLNANPKDGSLNRAGRTGIILDGSANTLQNSTIAYSSSDGVFVGGSGNTVQHCTIHDVDYAGGEQAGIELAGNAQQILHNNIYFAGRSGILDTNSTANRIFFNSIHDVGLQTTDLGGIYDWGTDSRGTEIAFNNIYNIHSGGYGAGGIYLDNGSAHYIVHSNYLTNIDHPLKFNPPSYSNQVYNNQVSGASGNQGNPNGPGPYLIFAAGVTDLGTLGGYTSDAVAISNRGLIVGSSKTGTGAHAFITSGGALQDLGTLGGTFSEATAINSAGLIVGASYPAAGAIHAFLYQNQKMVDLGTLPGDSGSRATSINSAGQIAGTSCNVGGIGHAFFYSGGKMQAVGTLGGSISAASGANDFGLLIGSSTLPGDLKTHAFVRWQGKLWDMGTLGGSNSYALALNNRGQMVGESQIAADGAYHAFIYSNGAMHDLGTMSGFTNFVATGINDNGDVVGYAYASNPRLSHAFYYHNGVMHDLNSMLAGTPWTFSSARSINNLGQIVGVATDPSEYQHAIEVQV